jgi:lipopolysaccharide/colanic/teichoic acid biosynthesis glycosyltransferase
MIKRLVDILASFFGLLFFSPILFLTIFLIWKEDKKSPFYIAVRLGKNAKPFKMIKLRSMVFGADKSGVVSSSDNDMRITPIGHKIRKYKLDEFIQLWNVLKGDMSLVGPRPNVKDETDLYTSVEKELFLVRPGITDLSSIVFSDEGEILKGKDNPDLTYNQLIRPWKSRLGLIYIKNQSLLLDTKIIYFTLVALFSRKKSLNWVTSQLKLVNADINVIKISKREEELYPFPPPGADRVITER